jgi:hypothetical protein
VFTVTLASQPTDTVTIGLQADGDECTVSPDALLLDVANWQDGATATVTAQNDDAIDGEQTCTIVTAAATSLDTTYAGEDPDDVSVTVTDDDVAGFTFSPPTLTLAEPAEEGIFTITLTSQPTAAVSFGLQASTDECTVSPARLILDAINWQAGAPVTVTVQDDDLTDGEQMCPIETGRTKSADPNYDHLNPPDFYASITDNDLAGITVSPSTLAVAEPQGQGTLTLALTSQPLDLVTVDLQTAGDECALSTTTLALDASNWQSGATATVTAVDDDVVDGEQTCTVVTEAAVSTDAAYDSMNPDDLVVTVTDDDFASIVVSPTSLIVAEPSGQGSFTVTLTSQPTGTVTIGLQEATDECAVSTAALILDASNWQVGATATVTAQNDDLLDGDQACAVVTAAVQSADPNYAGLDPDDVAVTVTDDEVARFALSPVTLRLTEPAGQDIFTLTLTSQPTDTVTIGLQADSDECAVSPDALILDATTWQKGATATVRVQDDDVADGEKECTVVTAAASSADRTYDGQDPANVIVTVVDDDLAGFMVSPAALIVAEPDGQNAFDVSLTSQPTDTVMIGLRVTGNQCSVLPTAMQLDATNWQTGKTVTVAAQDDDIVDGEQVCEVVTEAAVSTDPAYDGMDPDDVAVTVVDDDIAGITVSPTSLTLTEPDGQATFTVSLTGQPTDTVTMDLAVGSDQCTVSPGSLVLDETNWQTGATATVTAEDDDLVDGAQECIVETERARSPAASYDGIDPQDVEVTVMDDDTAGVTVGPTILTVSEPDGTSAFVVTLQSQPTAPVSIDLSVSNSECSVAPTSIVLHASNWNDGGIAIVTAVDDDQDDDRQTCVVYTAPTSSADPNYDGIDPKDVIVAVYDDEVIHRIYLPSMENGWPAIPSVPTLVPIDNVDGNGSYTVTWTASSQAETYVLEEATNSSFLQASVVYSGPAMSYAVSGRGAARYYYRAKARLAWAESEWSGPRTTDVRWEGEPNDRAPDQVNGPLVPNLVYYGTFLSSEDLSDYFFVDLSTSDRIYAWLTSVPEGMNYDLVLRDADLVIKGYSAELSNDEEEIRTGILPAGRYYIQVFHRNGGGSAQAYHLRYALE